jgi:predicted MFS family arabinose efflux permease
VTTRAPSLGPLREREFRLLFTGQLVSLTGSAMAPIALAFAVLEIGTPSDLGFVLAAGWIPQIVFILVGGVWADRLPRNLIMVGGNTLSGVAQAGVAVLLLTHHAQLWELMALQIVRGTANAFFFPAAFSIVPHVVPKDQMQQANALLRLSQTTTTIFGAALGGVLVATIGSGWAIAFDAATYLASAGIMSRMRIRIRARVEQSANFIRELVEGWNEFRARTWLWLIVVAAGLMNASWVGSQSVLGPVVAKRALHGATGWGLVSAAEAIGLVAAGLVALRWRPRRLLLYGVIGLLAAPVLIATLAVPAPLPFVLVAGLVAGFGIELFGVYWLTALQQHIPDEVLARVNSYDALGSFVLIPIGLTLVGPLADAIGVSTTLWLSAAFGFVITAACLFSRDVRRLERNEQPILPDHGNETAPVPIL